MDIRKFDIFRRGLTKEEQKKRADQAFTEEKIKKDKGAVARMVNTKGWKMIEEWKVAERENTKMKLYKAVKDRNIDLATKYAADIEAINKLFATINQYLVN